MGQNANTTILQISTNKSEALQKHTANNKEEFSLLTYKNNKLLIYLTKVFDSQNYWVNQIKLDSSKKRLNIFVSFYKTKDKLKIPSQNELMQVKKLINKNVLINLNLYEKSKTIKLKTQNLNKQLSTRINNDSNYKLELKNTLLKLKPFLKNQSFQETIHALLVIATNPFSANLLNKIITNFLTENKKQHNFFLSFIKKSLIILIKTRLSKINGVKIIINGRLNGRPRARKTLITIGTVPQQSIKNKIDYAESTAYTKNGTFGVRSWIASS